MSNNSSENQVGGLIHIKYIEKLKEKKPNRICYLLDGGTNSKKAFDIITKEFLPRLKNRELIIRQIAAIERGDSYQIGLQSAIREEVMRENGQGLEDGEISGRKTK